MTIKTEYRLLCDYCGNVSPASQGQEVPHGWIEIRLMEPRELFPFMPVYHFCTSTHRDAWLAEHPQEQTA